jgi:hypothetical protein
MTDKQIKDLKAFAKLKKRQVEHAKKLYEKDKESYRQFYSEKLTEYSTVLDVMILLGI